MFIGIKDTLIIDWNFNDELNGKINKAIKTNSKLIFSDFEWKEKYEDIYINKKGIYKNTIKLYKHNLYNYRGARFNKQIDNKLPFNVKYISLGHSFNQTVDNLGSGLEEIIFGYSFNQRVDNLPFTIKLLTFGYSFNKPVDNIPNSIIYLSLSYSFNCKLDNLPIGLETLCVGKNFSHNINCLPKTLKYLEIKSKYFNDKYYLTQVLNIYRLPKNLEIIVFKYKNHFNEETNDKYNLDNIKYKFGKNKIITY